MSKDNANRLSSVTGWNSKTASYAYDDDGMTTTTLTSGPGAVHDGLGSTIKTVDAGGVGTVDSGGGVQGAAADCAAVASYAIDQYLGSNPLSQCLNWGTAGAVTAGLAGAAVGCAAGAASWVDTNSSPSEKR